MASVVFTENPTKSINPLILTDFSSFCPHSQFFVVSLRQKRGESPKHWGSLLFLGKKNGCFTSEVENFTSESGFFFSESGFFLGVCGRNFADVKFEKLKDIYF